MTTNAAGTPSAGHPRLLLAQADALLARASFLGAVLTALGILSMMLLVVGDILGRNLFEAPIPGVSDFVSYAIVGCVFLPLGATIREGRLVRAVFLADPLAAARPGLARTLELLFGLAALAMLWIAARYLWSDALSAWRDDEFLGAVGAYRIATWPFKLTVALGCTLALAEAAAGLIRLCGAAGLAGAARAAAPAAAALLFGAGVLGAEQAASAGLDRVGVGLAALAALLALIALGMPIVFGLMLTSFVGIWLVRDMLFVAENSVGISAASAVRSQGFAVIPLFVMMGLLLDRAGVGRDAFRIMAILVRGVVGGLGVATVGANAIFASITGSSIASATVFSRIAVPPMTEAGYSKRFSLGIVAGSSVLGMLIPPSLLMIVYGLLSESSIGDLFIAGIVPGLVLTGAFAAIIMLMARFAPAFAGETRSGALAERLGGREIARRLLPVAAIVALVMGGIYGGLFSPTEAGAAGAFGALLIALARRSVDWREFRALVVETGAITAGLLFLMIAANIYGRMLAMSTIPNMMAGFVAELDLTLIGFAFLYALIVVLLGMILDSVSIMLIVLPIALPIVEPMGADLIWFGIVTVIAVEIGLLTPPFGLSVYVVKGSLPDGYATLGDIFIAAAPFVLTMAAVTALLIVAPGLSLLLL